MLFTKYKAIVDGNVTSFADFSINNLIIDQMTAHGESQRNYETRISSKLSQQSLQMIFKAWRNPSLLMYTMMQCKKKVEEIFFYFGWALGKVSGSWSKY